MSLVLLVKRFAARLGVEVRRMPGASHVSEDGTYQLVRPHATYSPWCKDAEFQRLRTAVQHATLVDEYRCWELWQLVAQAAKLPRGALIEVGVWRGGSGALIAHRARSCGITEPVLLCDTFSGVVKAGDRDTRYRGGEHADTDRGQVERLIADLRIDGVRILQGTFPEQTGTAVENLEFRFCHIDVDVYRSAKDVVAWIWPRLVPGGIIVFDDFGFKGCEGVTALVEELASGPGSLVLHNLNGHAVMIRLV